MFVSGPLSFLRFVLTESKIQSDLFKSIKWLVWRLAIRMLLLPVAELFDISLFFFASGGGLSGILKEKSCGGKVCAMGDESKLSLS